MSKWGLGNRLGVTNRKLENQRIGWAKQIVIFFYLSILKFKKQ